MDRDTEKLIQKHREVFKLHVCCYKLAILATVQCRIIERNPDAYSRMIEMQMLAHNTKVSIREVVEIAVDRVRRIDARL